MWLDADDIITEENKEKILKLKESLNPAGDVGATGATGAIQMHLY